MGDQVDSTLVGGTDFKRRSLRSSLRTHCHPSPRGSKLRRL